jgi:hypothetical protein
MGTSASFETHPVRGRFNAGFFGVLDGYINWLVRDNKCKVFSELPREVVEIGPGVGPAGQYSDRRNGNRIKTASTPAVPAKRTAVTVHL